MSIRQPRIACLACFALLTSTALPVWAEEQAAPVKKDAVEVAVNTEGEAQDPNSMTLTEALAIGYKQNFGLEIAREAVAGSDARESAAFRALLPSLSLSSSHTQYYENDSSGFEGDSHSAALAVTQPLYRGRSLWAGWKTSELNLDKAQLAEHRAIQQLARDIKAGWYELHRARKVRDETEKSLERLQQHAKNARAFYAEGKYWRNDVLQAEVEVARGKQRLAEANNAFTLAASRLNQLLRRDVATPLHPADTMAFSPLDMQLDAAFSLAASRRPELRQAAIDVKTAKYGEITAEAGAHPSIDLSANWNTSATTVGFNDHQDTQTVLVTMSWPLFQWGRTLKQVEAAQATTRQVTLTLKALQDRVQLEVQQAFLDAQAAAEQVGVLEQALEQAEENYRVNQIRYREQLSSANDLLDAQALLTSTRIEYVTALASYLTALADLELAVGTPVMHTEEKV